ncbi:MAG TPA: hypothetical protein VH639_04430 [Bryobacteraceae bacterium]
MGALNVHLIDGTYELFRHYYAVPSARDQDGREIGAVRGVLKSLLGMIKEGATHIAVATDHVIESFRNDLWPGYKTGEASNPVCSHNSRCLRRPSPLRASWSGRWWNLRLMTRLLLQPRHCLRTDASNA